MIRQQSNSAESDFVQDLSADTVIASAAVCIVEASGIFCFFSVNLKMTNNIAASSLQIQVQDHTFVRRRNNVQRPLQLPSGIVKQSTKHVAQDTLSMYANQRLTFGF